MDVRRLLPVDPKSRCLGGDAFRHPKPGASGAGVEGDFLLSGNDALGGHEAQPRGSPADAHGGFGRADATASLSLEEVLHDAVFQRVIAEDGEPTARTQQLEGPGEPFGQRFELFVDGDAQRLEYPGGRMDSATTGRPRRGDALDQSGEFLGCLDRGVLACLDDRPGDPAREGLLAKAADFLIVYQSTYAVDGFALGKPVISLWDDSNFFDEFKPYKVFTEVKSAKELREAILKFLNGFVPPANWQEARRACLNENGEDPDRFIASVLKNGVSLVAT